MKITVTESIFKAAFVQAGRGCEFSQAGLSALFDYLEGRDASEDTELNIIALCCEFSEESYEDIANYHDIDLSGCKDSEEEFNTVLNYLQYETSVVCFDEDAEMILYQNF